MGARITFDNSQELELQHWINQMWKASYKYSDLLCCRECPIAPRLILLNVLVRSALFWCAGSWHLTHRQLSKLRAAQQAVLRKMLRLRCRPDETTEDFCTRYARSIKDALHQHGQEPWDVIYHKLVFTWAGKISRMGKNCPDRLTYKIFRTRDWQTIQDIAHQNGGNQLHCRRFRVWRWEQQVYKCFQGSPQTWRKAAENPQRWSDLFDEMVLMRSYA